MVKAGKALFWEREGHLVPVDDAGREIVASIEKGKSVLVEVKVPRNPARLRKFWVLVDLVRENLGREYSREAVANYLKVRAGHVDVFMRGGEVVEVPKSVAFDSCPEGVFNAFFNRCIRVVVEDVIPGLEESALRKELEEMVR